MAVSKIGLSDGKPPAPENPDMLTHDFLAAVDRFRSLKFTADVFGEEYRRIYGDTKRKEAITFLRTVSSFDYQPIRRGSELRLTAS